MLGTLLLMASALAVDLRPTEFKEVTFGGIPPTRFELAGDALKMTVEKSSSFLLLPFSQARTVASVSFSWQTDGELKVPDAATEKTKAGDDGRLKIALLLSGKEPLVPFFAPAWIKAVREHMRLPADRAMILLVGAKTPAGETWPSPYSGSIDVVSVGGRDEGKGWQRVDVKLAHPVEVAGLWLMADGDDTGSSFTTRLRDLTLR